MLRNWESVRPPDPPSFTGSTHASITQFVGGKLHRSGVGTVLFGPWIHIPELAQPKEPQRVADVLITPAGPRGPPAPNGTITAAGFPPPPAPGTHPDENAAEAGERLIRHKIGCLPVVEGDAQLVGVVTEEDFLRWATAEMARAS